jgi:hypothetical protein
VQDLVLGPTSALYRAFQERVEATRHFRYWRIVLQKSFCITEHSFSRL